MIGPICQPLLQCPTSKQNFCVAHFSIQSPQTWALGVANSVASPGQRLSQASSIVQVAAGRNLEILYPQQMCGVERGRTFRPSVVVTSGPSGTRGGVCRPKVELANSFSTPAIVLVSGLCDTRLSSTEVWLLPTLESPQSCGGERSTLGAAASQEDRLPHPTGQHTERARL